MDEALEEFSRVAEKEAEEIESPAHGQEANRYEYSTVELTRWRGPELAPLERLQPKSGGSGRLGITGFRHNYISTGPHLYKCTFVRENAGGLRLVTH